MPVKNTRKKLSNHKKTRKHRGGVICPAANATHYNIGPLEFTSTWHVYRNIRNSNVLIKQVGPATWLTEDTIQEEFELATIAAILDVGPHVYSFCIKKDEESGLPIGYLIMERIIGKTFAELYGEIENIPKDIFQEYRRLMDILYDNGLKYHDRHLHNFMLGHTNTSTKDRVWIIDFGGLRDFKPGEKRNYRLNAS